MRKFLLSLIAVLFPVMAQAQNAAPAACAPLKKIATIKMEREDPYGWAIPVTINGVPKRFLFNPGLGASVMKQDIIREMKLETALKRPQFDLSVAPRRVMAHIDSLVLANSGQLANVDIIQVLRLVRRDDPDTFAGVLGLDIFSRFDFDMDLANGIVNLFSPDHCEGQVVYWKTDAAIAVPFTYDAFGQMRVPVTLNGVATTANLVPLRDENRMLMANMLKLMNIGRNSTGVEMLEPDENGLTRYSRRFDSLAVEGLTINNPVIVMFDAPGAGSAGAVGVTMSEAIKRENEKNALMLLGRGTLSKLHVFFASREMKLYISLAPQVGPAP